MLTCEWHETSAESLVRDHFTRIAAMWWQNRHLHDLIGVLCVERVGRWSLAMSNREAKIEEAPEILMQIPNVSRPAWAVVPQVVPGTAMWLVVGAPNYGWKCLRVAVAWSLHHGQETLVSIATRN